MIQKIEKLFYRQMRTWPQLAKGAAGLKRAKTRAVQIDWFTVFIRHIPHRMVSTTASVDRESIARRPCFLCAGNLPAEEEGVRFDDDFTIYCNPLPIVDKHLTIVHREHGTQHIANRFGNILDLAAALPGYFVIYNGPECGASAPDHLHFQAGSRRLFPIERDTAGITGITVPGYVRNAFLLRGRDRSALNDRMERTLELLAETEGRRGEPMINLAVFHERGEWLTYLFPRSKHRPEVFHSGELTVSPASIDLCGIFVVPLAQDFEKITGEAIAAIFREVTLPDAQFQEVAQRLESGR
jgi:ATP adenylyltransferase/5',5'''-P-1,P-4-tetraphosphate phosphorylase II